jgi:hypothetical protein
MGDEYIQDDDDQLEVSAPQNNVNLGMGAKSLSKSPAYMNNKSVVKSSEKSENEYVDDEFGDSSKSSDKASPQKGKPSS